MSTNQPSKKERRREELRRREAAQRRAARRRLLLKIAASIIVMAIVVVSLTVYIHSLSSASASKGSNNANRSTPALVSDNPQYPAINNIACSSTEQLDYHVHSHLSIYINGQAVPVSQNIGIAADGSCFFWLHTHDTTGMIHMEAPGPQTFTLGTFLKLWKEQFATLQYPTQLNSINGWLVFVDGKPYSGDLSQLELKPHRLVTLAYNSPDIKPETVYSWPPGQ